LFLKLSAKKKGKLILLPQRLCHSEAMVYCVKTFLPIQLIHFPVFKRISKKIMGSKQKMYVNYAAKSTISKFQHRRKFSVFANPTQQNLAKPYLWKPNQTNPI
jgi:hypothetical protein